MKLLILFLLIVPALLLIGLIIKDIEFADLMCKEFNKIKEEK